MSVIQQDIEVMEENYAYEFINERECKTTIRLILHAPSKVDRYNYIINGIINNLKVHDNKGLELQLIFNEQPKNIDNFYDYNKNINLKTNLHINNISNNLNSITILLASDDELSQNEYKNFEIIITYILFNNSNFSGFFSDSIDYHHLLIGERNTLTLDIKVPQQYGIDIKTLNLISFESDSSNNENIPFEFILKDTRHLFIKSLQNNKISFTIIKWKIVIHKINLNWIRFGFCSGSFIIAFIPIISFFHPPSLTSIVGTFAGLLGILLAIRLRNIFEISLVEKWNTVYILMLVSIIIEAIFTFFIKLSL